MFFKWQIYLATNLKNATSFMHEKLSTQVIYHIILVPSHYWTHFQGFFFKNSNPSSAKTEFNEAFKIWTISQALLNSLRFAPIHFKYGKQIGGDCAMSTFKKMSSIAPPPPKKRKSHFQQVDNPLISKFDHNSRQTFESINQNLIYYIISYTKSKINTYGPRGHYQHHHLQRN